VLEANAGADLLNPDSWKKFDQPFFKQDPQAGVYGPGHNGFFLSPDGKENWIIYHANSSSDQDCASPSVASHSEVHLERRRYTEIQHAGVRRKSVGKAFTLGS
jgi:GH43 family beta-xylosidase